MSPSCTVFRDIVMHFPNFKEVTWLWTKAPLLGAICMHALVPISTRNFKCIASPIWHIWLGQNVKNEWRDLDRGWSVIPRLIRDIFYLHEIWRLSLQPFRRWLRASRLKMCHVTLTVGHQHETNSTYMKHHQLLVASHQKPNLKWSLLMMCQKSSTGEVKSSLRTVTFPNISLIVFR